MIITQLSEILNIKLTSGNVHDVAVLEFLTQELEGILLTDKRYISKIKTELLASKGLKLLTTSPKNMKNPPAYSKKEKRLLSKWGLIETVNDQLKNIHQIEHSRHRSVNKFMGNVMAAVVAYCLSANKSSFKNIINN